MTRDSCSTGADAGFASGCIAWCGNFQFAGPLRSSACGRNTPVQPVAGKTSRALQRLSPPAPLRPNLRVRGSSHGCRPCRCDPRDLGPQTTHRFDLVFGLVNAGRAYAAVARTCREVVGGQRVVIQRAADKDARQQVMQELTTRGNRGAAARATPSAYFASSPAPLVSPCFVRTTPGRRRRTRACWASQALSRRSSSLSSGSPASTNSAL